MGVHFLLAVHFIFLVVFLPPQLSALFPTSSKPVISPSLFSFFFTTICSDPIDTVEALLRVMSEIVLTSAEGEIQLEK